MFGYADFKRPREIGDYVEIAKWKMKVVASFYTKFARAPIIGGPPNTFMLLPQSAGRNLRAG
jgi:hypothetical protein